MAALRGVAVTPKGIAPGQSLWGNDPEGVVQPLEGVGQVRTGMALPVEAVLLGAARCRTKLFDGDADHWGRVGCDSLNSLISASTRS